MKSYVLHTIGGAKFYKEAQQCDRPHGGQDAPTIGGAQGEPTIYLPPPFHIRSKSSCGLIPQSSNLFYKFSRIIGLNYLSDH